MATKSTIATPSSVKSADSRPFDESQSKPEAMMLAPSIGKASDRDRTLLSAVKHVKDLEEGSVDSQKADTGVLPPEQEEIEVAERNRKRKKALCIGLVFSLIIGTAAGVGGYFLLRNRDSFGSSKSQLVGMEDPPTDFPSESPTPGPTVTSEPSASPSISLQPSASFFPSTSPSHQPSPSPTMKPSAAPSPSPTISPSAAPTDLPSSSPTVSPAPTIAPSSAPTRDLVGMLKVFFFGDYGVDVDLNEAGELTPNIMAINWLSRDSNQDVEFDEKLVQRFALVTLDLSLQGAETADDAPRNAELGVNQCDWKGIVCSDDGMVEEVNWSYQPKGRSGSGSIAPVVRLLAGSLKRLDLSNNDLVGEIPEAIYKLTNLEKLYLFKNDLGGTISSKIENLQNITHFHLSHNNLVGGIPSGIKSGDEIRPLLYLNLYSNNLTGTLPQNMRLRNVRYFDVGRNQLTGTLPVDLGEKFVWLRHLHLDHNNFVGTLPASYNTVGNGRLESFSIDHNQLTGIVPGERTLYNKLVQYTLQSNNFSGMDKDACKMEVPYGETVELRSDCNACPCNGYFNICDLQCKE